MIKYVGGRKKLTFLTVGSVVYRGVAKDGADPVFSPEAEFKDTIRDFLWLGGDQGKAMIQLEDGAVWHRIWDRPKQIAKWTAMAFSGDIVPTAMMVDL